MTSSEAVKLRIMTYHGWSVSRIMPHDHPEGYWRAIQGSNEIVEFSMEELFQSWTEHDAVLEQVFRVSINRKDQGYGTRS